MAEQTPQARQYAEAVATILEGNGLGDRNDLIAEQIEERARDAGGNLLLRAEVGNRRYFVTLSPALRGRLVGEDRIEDEEVRIHFEVNIVGDPLPKR